MATDETTVELVGGMVVRGLKLRQKGLIGADNAVENLFRLLDYNGINECSVDEIHELRCGACSSARFNGMLCDSIPMPQVNRRIKNFEFGLMGSRVILNDISKLDMIGGVFYVRMVPVVIVESVFHQCDMVLRHPVTNYEMIYPIRSARLKYSSCEGVPMVPPNF